MKRSIIKQTAIALLMAAITFAASKKDPAPTPVAGVTISQTALTLAEGRTTTLRAEVTPADAENKQVSWTSDKPSVATVADGVVTAVAAGAAKITAYAGGKSAACTVTVTGPAPVTMTMTTAKAGRVSIGLAGSGAATIDWGDGSAPQAITLSAYNAATGFTSSQTFAHAYAAATARTVTVTAGNVTHLYCYDNDLTTLDVSKNAVLKTRWCHKNKLTALDVSKSAVLNELFCQVNQLGAAGLNALFGTLHGNNTGSKWIYIRDNPGAGACTQKIATDKGWTENTTSL
jgi:hypothetical protein